MFRETLLESSSFSRKTNPWPISLAFAIELLAAGFFLAMPIFTTGGISVSSRPPRLAPISSVRIRTSEIRSRVSSASSPTKGTPAGAAVSLGRPLICLAGCATRASHDEQADLASGWEKIGDRLAAIPCEACSPAVRPRLEQQGRVKVSHLSEALLIEKIEPTYPSIAAAAGITGAVQLHAVIGKNGRIQELSVISGHPLLAAAALEAVKRWRYRPYELNSEPVEVETYITVIFRK